MGETAKCNSEKHTACTVRDQDWIYESAGENWRDGMLLGNGSLGVLSYAPGAMEWLFNKTDIFDGRVPGCKMLRHDKVMRHVEDSTEKTSYFLDAEEKKRENYVLRSVSAFVLRLYYGNGELDWNAPAFPKISQRLSLYEGELYTKADAHFAHSEVKSFVLRSKNLFALRLEGCSVSDWEHTIEIYRPHNDDMEFPVWCGGDGELCFEQTLPGKIGAYAVALKIVPRIPDESRVTYPLPKDFRYRDRTNAISGANFGCCSAAVHQQGDMDIFVSVCTSYESVQPLKIAQDTAAWAAERGFELLERENKAWWKDFWGKSSVDFGKYCELQRYWYFSVYELACSYGKAPMPALNGMAYGPLSETKPGVSASNYVHDQNVQIPVMPLPVVNHADLAAAFADTYIQAEKELKRHTKELFCQTGGDGIFIPLVTNQAGKEIPSGSYRYTMCGSAYVGLILCKIWDYSRDIRLMKEKLYPLLCELIRFYVNNMLHEDKNGTYHLDWSIPPEIFSFTKDDTATLSMLKTCMETAVRFDEEEEICSEEHLLWCKILENYPSLAKRNDGAWWGGLDIDEEHFCFGTHLLYPFFPAEAYLSETDRQTARKTLAFIEKNALERSYAGENGWHFVHDWSWFLYYMTRLRLGDAGLVWNKLHEFLRDFAKTNGLFVHNSIVTLPFEITEKNHETYKPAETVTADMTTTPPWYSSGKCATPNEKAKRLTAPVIEGNSIFLLCTTETLLQSFDGIIRLFPGVPDDFDGGFSQLHTRGGFSVSAEMKKGKVISARIYSGCGGTFRLYNRENALIPSSGDVKVEGVTSSVLTARLMAGQSVEFVSEF